MTNQNAFDALLTEKARCIREFFKLSEDLYFECYLVVVYLLNKTSMLLNWQSSLIKMQQSLKELIKWKLNHLKIFDFKTYILLKELDVSSRLKKIKTHVFVNYLIDYDLINIFKVWNLEKNDVNDYSNVIFDENVYYDINNNNKRRLIKESKSKNLMQFRICSIKPAINVELLNSNKKKWLKTSVRDKLMLKNRTIKKRSIEITEEMKKSVQLNDDSKQLFTFFESVKNNSQIDLIIYITSIYDYNICLNQFF